MTLKKIPIARRRAALERQVYATRNIVATLSEIQPVHVKLRLAQGKLADRERHLDRFNAEHPGTQ
jgi:hypothetical protein